MFLDWENQYCENDNTTLGNLKIKCNPQQITKSIFQKLEKKKTLKICMETQKTRNSQMSLEKEKRNWKNQAPRLQTILQNYSH